MNTDKRTPGPWRYRRTNMQSSTHWFVILDRHGRGPIFDVGGDEIAEAKYLSTDPEEIEANAAFIVRACNNHDALVEISKEMLKHLLETDFDVCGTPDKLVDKWKATIANAEK